MKKTYIQPQSKTINFTTEGMIATSVAFDNTPGGEQLSNKKQYSGWGEENEEQKNEFWN